MKHLILLIILLTVETVLSQQSYDFAIPVPPNGKEITTISKSYFGNYSSKQVDVDYEFNKEGVWAIAFIYSTISRETIRESSKYRVKDGFLFGVHETDSIPCELQGEYYHFAVKYKEQIAGGTAKNILVKISESSYILNFEDNGHYTPSLFEFKGKSLNVQHFTYEEGSKLFDGILNRTETSTPQMNYILLEPTATEWNAIPQKDILGEKIIFGRM